MFTKEQVLDILKEIDEDKTNTIDFFECLQVCVTFATEICMNTLYVQLIRTGNTAQTTKLLLKHGMSSLDQAVQMNCR